jgi:hypothetical protein
MNAPVLTDLLKILLPAALVLYAMYLMVKSFLEKEFNQKALQIKATQQEVSLPIRLQAYERMVLYLERITPNNLLRRYSGGQVSARELQSILVHDVREELGHNLSQQLYMSAEVWNSIQQATEEVISMINTAADSLPTEAQAQDLSRAILQNAVDSGQDPTGRALFQLKKEVHTLF